MARFLAGQEWARDAQGASCLGSRQVTIVDAGARKDLDLRVITAVPDILRDVRGQERAAAGPADLGAVAAVVVPSEESAAELPFAGRGAPAPEATASPDVIGPGHATQRAAASSTLPLAVGADPLSRYLRDNNVRFTGQVLGPLSVGVFRANGQQQPFVVTLGQTLPDTDIVLSDLRGYEASFSLGNQTQVLSLDTRR